MNDNPTPLLPDAPRVLVHAWTWFSPLEIDFWQRLRGALRNSGREMVLAGYARLKTPLDVPYARVFENLDAVRRFGFDLPENPKAEPEDRDDALLERERLWTGEEEDVRHKERRRRALSFLRGFYRQCLEAVEPSLVVLWNGEHTAEMILKDLCQKQGRPVVFLERGPFRDTLFFDPQGINVASAAARRPFWRWENPEEASKWRQEINTLRETYLAGRATWWAQPDAAGPEAIRRRFGIPKDRKIIFFAGQMDRDTSSFLFSPHFRDNADAFRWFCRNLPPDEPLFILGKHHPQSKRDPEDYREALNGRGVWVTDVSLQDCLDLADRVASVNSTVLYEALLLGKPVLALGDWLLKGREAAYELKDPASAGPVFTAWLEAADWAEKKEKGMEACAYLLKSSLYIMKSRSGASGEKDAAALAGEWVRYSNPENTAGKKGSERLAAFLNSWGRRWEAPGRAGQDQERKNRILKQKIKLYAFYTPSHRKLKDRWFLASLKDDYEIILDEYPQDCPSGVYMRDGWNRLMIRKIDLILRAIRENPGQLFIYSDVDIQFFEETRESLADDMAGLDFAVHRETAEGGMCTGFMPCWGGEGLLRLWQDIRAYCLENPSRHEQHGLNELLGKYPRRSRENPYGIRWDYLPLKFFGPGPVLNRVRWYPKREFDVPEDILLHHANWTHGVRNKEAQLRYVKTLVKKRRKNVYGPRHADFYGCFKKYFLK